MLHAAVDDAVLRDGQPAIDLLDPISRLGGIEWGHTTQIDSTSRIPFKEWPGHYSGAGS